MTIYLYVKTHRKTGLKYLGKTESKDPRKYRGSGIYWERHIKQHGYDVDTEILRECKSNEEVKEWGLYYSNLFNIVESDEWANLTEESGAGGSSEQTKRQWENNPELRETISNSTKKTWKDPAFREKKCKMTGDQMRKLWQDDKFREKNCKISRDRLLELWQDSEYRNSRTGKNNPNHDNTIYHWINVDGREEHCTQYDLLNKYPILHKGNLCSVAKGNRLRHKGWYINKEFS